ncbi:MAG: chromosome segregation protein SMC [Acidimicrobiia bacterium]|nr:chromosome segregation protein SMC [Acidimicrobiia bacterium]
MFLKTLTLAGFKSFADRTRLDFERGVNVVVGPNGSGKSNIVDAVAWVMGTQATSVLRTDKMDDVIFSGTATRAKRGKAEVSLTFDNSERMLPLDLDEVTLTRRLHRDGTSDYEINGTACRLLDFQELLADSHVGRHQHVIIAQGRIGSILNAAPVDNRAVIEEAAGVVKHRNRRDRSIKRLDATAEDVKRLKDILREQRKRMRPLRRQAEAADRHDSVKDEAQALSLHIGGEALRQIRTRLSAAEVEQGRLDASVTSNSEELASIADSLTKLEASAGEAGQALERDTTAAARLETTAERLQRYATVGRERRLALEAQQRDAGVRRRDLELESQSISEELAQAGGEQERWRTEAETAVAALEALEDEERSLADQDALGSEGAAAAVRGDLRALEAAQERDRREQDAIARRVEVVSARISDEERELQQLHGDVTRTDTEVGASQQAFHGAQETRRAAERSYYEAEEAAQRANFELVTAVARVEAIEAALSGMTDPATRDRAASFDAIVGTIAQRLDVPPELSRAVDVALGAWADALAATDRDGVEEVVSGLRSEGLGGVPVVSAAAAAADVDAPARKVAAQLGVDALVDRLGPEADQNLANQLLGDVLLLEGWSSAWGIVQRHSELRAVTPEGDLISSFGVRPSDPLSPAALDEAKAGVDAAGTKQARADSRMTTSRRELDHARQAESAARESLEVLEARLGGATEASALVERARAEGSAELSRLDQRRRALAEQEAARLERLSELRSRLDSLEAGGSQAAEAWESLATRREQLTLRREAASASRDEATASLAASEERERLLRTRMSDIASTLQNSDAAPTIDPAEITRLASIESRAQSALGIVRSNISELRERQRALRRDAGDAGGKLSTSHQRQRRLEESLSQAKDRLSELAVETAELRVRDEAVQEGLRRDVDASAQDALDAPRPEGLEGDVDVQAKLDSLRAELERMGPVNPLAAAEYHELSEEAEFLEGQLADLEESRTELRKVITALDEQIGTLFTQAFNEIAAYFEENFGLLFPGGTGRLRLTDPDDPLETGVELGAQPLGKRVSKLSLLSGGERSLAALAFLFAVFRARPSPFYILDEVEAALDDANLHRFLRLIDVMRGTSQLAVITHQQQTMEAADILYGVTMEPGESSKVLAKRLDNVKV